MEQITDNQFDSVISSNAVPVLVDFWATWCMPCRMMEPVLEELSKELGDKIRITKMNVDENQVIPQKFGITGIPNLMLFKGGKMVENIVGAVPKAQLLDVIRKHI